VEPELERGDDAEVAATTTQTPEQVRVLLLVGGQELPIGGDDVGGKQVVTGQAVLAQEPPEATTQRQTGHPGGTDEAAGCRQIEDLGIVIDLTPGETRLTARRAADGIDPEAFHRREVNHQATVADGVTGHVVAAAADSNLELVLAGEVDGAHDVNCSDAASNQGRMLVDHAVVDHAGRVVARVTGTEELATQARAERLDSRVVKGGREEKSDVLDGHGAPPGSRRLQRRFMGTGRGADRQTRELCVTPSSLHLVVSLSSRAHDVFPRRVS
jgi:hypothetical protein